MRMLMGLVLCFVGTIAARGGELDAHAKEIVGAWRLEFTTPDGAHRTPLVIVGRQVDELAAWYADGNDVQEFQEVKLTNDSVELTIIPKNHQGNVTVTLNAQSDGEGKCRGNAKYSSKSGDKGEWTFTGRRLGASDFDQVSQWELAFTGPDQQSRNATVTVVAKDGKNYGWYSASNYELPAKELSIDGDHVRMVMKGKTPHGSDVQVTFEGKVEGDQVKGDASYSLGGDTGTFPFTAKRKA